MKIREALVSNSSSTSFMVFHNKTDIYYLNEKYSNEKDFPENKYYISGDGYEGTDFFPITRKMFKLIKKNLDKFGYKEIYDVYLKTPDSEFSKKDFTDMISAFPEKFCMEIINIDNYITEKIEDFKEKYLNKE